MRHYVINKDVAYQRVPFQDINLYNLTLFANGVSSLNADHLTVFSTRGFQVKVKNTNALLQNGSKHIKVNTIQLKASAGTDAINGAQYAQGAILSANATTLVTSSTGAANKKISIDYKGAGANEYMDNYIAGQDPTVYTAELT